MSRALATWCAFFVFAALCTGPAAAQTSETETLTKLVVQTIPMGQVMQRFIDQNPNWPLNDKVGNATPEELKCLRARLGPSGYAAMRSEQVKDFAKRYPDRVADSIAVLEQGAAAFSEATFLEGINSTVQGGKADASAVLGKFSARQYSAYVDFIGNEKHRQLRDLMGIGETLVPRGRTTEDDKQRQENAGRMMSTRVMLDAMDYCSVSLKVLR